jgi:hypothetical protein
VSTSSSKRRNSAPVEWSPVATESFDGDALHGGSGGCRSADPCGRHDQKGRRTLPAEKRFSWCSVHHRVTHRTAVRQLRVRNDVRTRPRTARFRPPVTWLRLAFPLRNHFHGVADPEKRLPYRRRRRRSAFRCVAVSRERECGGIQPGRRVHDVPLEAPDPISLARDHLRGRGEPCGPKSETAERKPRPPSCLRSRGWLTPGAVRDRKENRERRQDVTFEEVNYTSVVDPMNA